MSNSIHTPRMAISLAVALAMAAITACGGGSTDTKSASNETSSTDSSSTGTASATDVVAAGVASAASEVNVTTNVSAVAIANGSTSDAVASSADGVDANSSATASDAAGAVVADSSVSPSPNTSAQVQPQSSGAVSTAVPVAAAAMGFHVAGAKLYDKNGKEFRIRGVNRVHWDSSSSAGIALSNANTERFVIDFTQTQAKNWATVDKAVSMGVVPMPGNWGGTCKSDAASLSAVVDTWVAQASTWTKYNSNGLINIANEWGPSNSTVWRDSYISAIARMRAAGYTGTLIVDSGGCGQDSKDIVNYGAAVLASDPQKNILFDVHVYGNFFYPATASWMQDYTKAMTAMKATGLAIILGEFGPGRKIGPSPTLVPPEQIIATAEAAGWGWMAWAWDDNNLPGCRANDGWFSMTTTCGAYKTDADLTAFGKTVVPLLKQMAVRASIF